MHAVHSKLRAGTGEAPTDPASAAATPSSLRSFLHLFDISRTKQRYLNEVLGGGGQSGVFGCGKKIEECNQ